MTKFGSPEDSGYRMVVAEIQAMIEKFKARTQAASDTPSSFESPDPVSHVGNNTHGALAMYGSSTLGDSARIGKIVTSFQNHCLIQAQGTPTLLAERIQP
jgi:hypothetical protein